MLGPDKLLNGKLRPSKVLNEMLGPDKLPGLLSGKLGPNNYLMESWDQIIT